MSIQEPAKEPRSSVLSADDEVIRHLGEDIDFARLAPGQTISVEALARRLRTSQEKTRLAIEHFGNLSLLKFNGDSCTIAAVERDHLVDRLDRRLEIEQVIAVAAARNAALVDRAEIEEASAMLKRCALVGDIDGYMMADRRLERAIGAAAQLPEVSAEVEVLKREFRRAWCAYNRLRDLNVPADCRKGLVSAILSGNTDAAKDAVKRFIDYLRQSY